MSLMLVGLVVVLVASCGPSQSTREAAFWKWFQSHENALFDFEKDQERTFDRLAAELHKVNPDLTFEFGPKEGDRREFVISADGIRDAFPAVEALYAAAPSLPRWRFVKFRPRRQPLDVSYGGVSVQASSVKVHLGRNKQTADLTVFIPGYTKAAEKTYLAIAFLLLDGALGEYDVEMRVGRITVEAAPTTTKQTCSLEALPTAFDALFASK